MIPSPLKQLLRKFRDFIITIVYFKNGRYCPVCNKVSKEVSNFGFIPREDAMCKHCGALERHRLVWLYLVKKTNLFISKNKIMLHIAPEAFFSIVLEKQLGNNYITADLNKPNVTVKMDLTNIQYPDESFDVIYCCHVLEHIQDDRKAIKELFRVLKRDGWGIILVPVFGEKTIEDPTITTPEERRKIYGVPDHVRLYGSDYIDRLRDAGFKVDLIFPIDFLSEKEIRRMGITKWAGDIYYCSKDNY